MSSLQNKVALVTGASRGIGNAIALALAEKGATVIGTATTEAGALKITERFNEKGLSGCGMCLNVNQMESIHQLFTLIKERFQMPSILINNAGITQDNLILRMKDEEWNQVIATNLNAIFYLTKTCIRDMIKSRFGRIINISSVVGSTGNAGQVNYSAAKAGLIGFSKSLAQEVGSRNITVNVVAPGFIETDMTDQFSQEDREAFLQRIPLQRLGKGEDIAAAVTFLASEAAGYITGQTLHINGGMYMA